MGEEGVNGCSVDSARKPVIPRRHPFAFQRSSLSFFFRFHIHLCWQLCSLRIQRRSSFQPSFASPPVTRLNRSRNCRDFASYTRYSRHDSPSPNGRRKIGIIITLQFFPLLTGVTGVTSLLHNLKVMDIYIQVKEGISDY